MCTYFVVVIVARALICIGPSILVACCADFCHKNLPQRWKSSTVYYSHPVEGFESELIFIWLWLEKYEVWIFILFSPKEWNTL